MSIGHCAEIVAAADPDRFRAALAAPPAARARLLPLWALDLEITRAAWGSAEPMIAAMRLQWWEDRIRDLGAGRAIAGQPLLDALAPLIAGDAEAEGVIVALIAARGRDAEGASPESAEDLCAHVGQGWGGMLWLGARALGAGEAARGVVADLGLAHGLAAWLSAVPALRARGLRALPPDADAAALAGRGLAALDRARAARGALSRAARPAIWPAGMAGAILRAAAADPGAVAAGALTPAPVRVRARLVAQALFGLW